MKNYLDEIEEIDDKELDDIQAEKRNKQLLRALNKISEILASKSEKPLLEAIMEQQEKINILINSLKNTEKAEISQNDFVSLTEQLRTQIIESNNKVIEAIQTRMLPDSFELVKNQYGVTQSVNVKYKPAIAIKT